MTIADNFLIYVECSSLANTFALAYYVSVIFMSENFCDLDVFMRLQNSAEKTSFFTFCIYIYICE